jgi:hypothetical protein
VTDTVGMPAPPETLVLAFTLPNALVGSQAGAAAANAAGVAGGGVAGAVAVGFSVAWPSQVIESLLIRPV